MVMKRPANQEEYLELVQQDVIEAEELRSSIEYDEEYMGDALGIAERLENQLKSLYAAMQDDSYAFADQDLEFMAIVNTAPDVWVPFKSLLKLINETHRLGLDA